MSRFACLLVADLPLAAALRAEPELRGRPLAIVDPKPGSSSPAILAGWLRGLTVAQARTVRSDLVVRPLSLEGVLSARQALFDVAQSVTPRVEESDAGIAYLDLDGTEALFPTPRGLLLALDKRLKEVGLDPATAGIGPTRTLALLAARHRGGWNVVEAAAAERFLGPLPLDLLEPSDEVFDRLSRWGVRTLGDLCRLPRQALGTRLGDEGVRLARRARGQDLEPFKPTPPRLRFEESAETGHPIDNLEALSFSLRSVLDRLARRLRLRGLAVRELWVELDLESGETFARGVGLGGPTVEASVLLSLVRLALEKDPPHEPVERVRIVAKPGALEPAQLDLFLPPLPAPAELAVTVARLEALCGSGRVGAPGLADSHRLDSALLQAFPERHEPRAQQTPALSRPTLALRAVRPPRPVRVDVRDAQPVRIETPDDGACRILNRAGPWRLFGEWWGETPFARDYFDVELETGVVCRIYRNLEDESWFIDGIYD
jgi:protein ImuB